MGVRLGNPSLDPLLIGLGSIFALILVINSLWGRTIDKNLREFKPSVHAHYKSFLMIACCSFGGQFTPIHHK